MKLKLGLFIFRRDLRLQDNTALIEAFSECDKVLPLFILTPQQTSSKNKFRSDNAIQFMMECLKDLNKSVSLTVLYGDEIKVIQKLFKEFKFEAIYFNKDYSPYSLKRDSRIRRFCKSNRIGCSESNDLLLTDTLEIKTQKGTYYKIFTQFYNNASKIKVRKPARLNNMSFLKTPYTLQKLNFEYEINDNIAIKGGRTFGKKILLNISKFKSYDKTRNYPIISTTMLSAHNKFGTVSIREVYLFIKPVNKTLLKQLYWRDFYYYVTYHFPHLYKYKHINNKSIKWPLSRSKLLKWQNALTGFPIVDAAMTELNTTGYMHNRCRMIVAMFLCKDLLIDWKYGEQYFSKKLIDIDRAQNLGNWNWSSSFGLDNSSFLRIFNPWTQSKTFDPKASYIKKWIPTLQDVPEDHIHKWFKYHSEYQIDYPKPMIDHDVERKRFIKIFNKYL